MIKTKNKINKNILFINKWEIVEVIQNHKKNKDQLKMINKPKNLYLKTKIINYIFFKNKIYKKVKNKYIISKIYLVNLLKKMKN